MTMRKYDLYWMSNREWYEYDKRLIPRLKENAPPEAKLSYKNYLAEKRRYKARILPPHDGVRMMIGDKKSPNKASRNRQIILE